MPTIHFVYPRDPARHASPFCIGNEVGDRLQQEFDVRFYGWRDQVSITPQPGDVLLGHPHWRRDSVFERSVRHPGWRRRILMAPYVDDLRQVAFYDRHMDLCDLFLAITGNYWFARIDDCTARRWKPKMRHMDLAVNREHFPFVKTRFNPPGQRKFVYIGHTAHNKNVGYLSQLSQQCPDADISWMGKGRKKIPGVKPLGLRNFADPAVRQEVAGYDFMITVGAMDANPTTIMEAMGWGLIPVVTRQSGYEHTPGIVNLPLADVAGSQQVFHHLQTCSDDALMELQRQGQRRLDEHFNWDRFYRDVRSAITGTDSPPIRPASFGERLKLKLFDIVH